MYFYVVYGLKIQSQIPLSWLVAGGDGSDVKVIVGDSPQHLALPSAQSDWYQIKEDELLLQDKKAGRVWVRRELVVLTPQPHFNIDILALLLLGSGMAALLTWRQKLLLHASAILLPNGNAIAFAGSKKAGKSTLAGFFYHDGHPLVSDDVCPLSIDKNAVWTEPGFPRLKLDPAILRAIGKNPADYPLLALKRRIKHSYPATTRFNISSSPLQAIYLLEEGASSEIIRMTPKDAVTQLMRHNFRPEFLVSTIQQQNALSSCVAVANKLTIYRLIRPKTITSAAGTVASLLINSQLV